MPTKFLRCEKLSDDHFYTHIVRLYNSLATGAFYPRIQAPKGFEEMVRCIYARHGKNVEIQPYELDAVNVKGERDAILVGYSGGLDSSYLALHLIDVGYKVTLFHVQGLNGQYPKEDEFARRFAANIGAEYIVCRAEHTGREHFIDNPLKNQVIMSLMLDYGIQHGIAKFGMGADWTTKIEDGQIGFTITDTIEVNEGFWHGVQRYWPEAELLFIDSDVKKLQRLEYIITHHPETLKDIYSCISPNRFNRHLHDINERKYGVKLMPGRCGSCMKCCMEWLLLDELEKVPKNDKYVAHCWQVLAESKNSHRRDLFGKGVPLDERRKNLLGYGS